MKSFFFCLLFILLSVSGKQYQNIGGIVLEILATIVCCSHLSSASQDSGQLCHMHLGKN